MGDGAADLVREPLERAGGGPVEVGDDLVDEVDALGHPGAELRQDRAGQPADVGFEGGGLGPRALGVGARAAATPSTTMAQQAGEGGVGRLGQVGEDGLGRGALAEPGDEQRQRPVDEVAEPPLQPAVLVLGHGQVASRRRATPAW
ncbi:hypothetical protein BJF79_38965 [Actinomadura sp. CNU-125]|nr:hypothetical protein BJF79_38965 [Actinomadura sp. CNU-125]